MDYPADWMLRVTRPVLTMEFDLGQHGKKEVCFEVLNLAYGYIPIIIAASTEIDGIKKMIGWVSFNRFHSLSRVSPDFVELRETKTDPEFFGRGIGKALVNAALTIAQENGWKLFLKPERPGEGLSKEYRDREFPMSQAEIRDFYSRHGFQDATVSERFRFSRAIVNFELAHSLHYEGFDPATGQFGSHRYSFDFGSELGAVLLTLPITTKLELLRKHGGWHNSRIKSCLGNTRGMMLAREDLKLPGFVSTYKIFHPPRPHPPIPVRVHI